MASHATGLPWMIWPKIGAVQSVRFDPQLSITFRTPMANSSDMPDEFTTDTMRRTAR